MGQANRVQVVGVGELVAAVVGWADSGHGTLAQQLAQGVRRAVASGLLPPGSRLPSERAIAAALSVSRSTVTTALDQLRADGVLTSRQGSGTTVADDGATPLLHARVSSHLARPGVIDLAMGYPPDASHLPPLQLDVAALLAGGEGSGVQPLGLSSLRRGLAARHSERGMHTDPSEIHITAGAHQAIATVLAASTAPGGVVLVEDPGHPGIYDIADSLGRRVVGMRRDGAGVVPERLDRQLAQQPEAIVYLQNGVHNPTGIVTTGARLRTIAEILDRHGATVIEDRVLAGVVFDGTEPMELSLLCRRATVVRVDSLSKVAWAGLRIGWIRAPLPTIDRTLHVRLASDLAPAVPGQLLALQLLPHLDGLAATRRASLQHSVTLALDVIGAELRDWKVEPPHGGSGLWIELPVDDTTGFIHDAAAHGVSVTAGGLARPGRTPDPHIRICVDRPDSVIEAGMARLVRAWAGHQGDAVRALLA